MAPSSKTKTTARVSLSIVIIFLLPVGHYASLQGRTRQPNFLIFLADDVGWGDLASYGYPTQEALNLVISAAGAVCRRVHLTEAPGRGDRNGNASHQPGAVDKLADEGVRFTQWYSAAPVCTPSRAALLTGRQPFRTGLYGSTLVLMTGHSGGLPHEEITIAEALRDLGYTTGIVGKWHLGTNEATFNDGLFLPHTHGFDYVGTILPYTLCWACDNVQRHLVHPSRLSCFLYRNTTIVEQPIRLERLTSTLVQDAKDFLYNNERRPFFFLFSLPQAHTPMFNNARFNGSSARGVYGDQINEMSWAVGEVVDTIKELKLERDTLVIFLSDNGPHREICEEGGHPGPFQAGKCHYTEGGLRMPAIAWWPGTVAPGRIASHVLSTMDIFPTLVELAGGGQTLPRNLDGQSFASILTERNTQARTAPPKETILFFYCHRRLVAVRYNRYKIYFYETLYSELNAFCNGGFPLRNFMETRCPFKPLDPWHVYDVEKDVLERWRLDVGTLGGVFLRVAQLVEEEESKMWDSREPLLVNEFVHRSLSPCCNPPYCACSY